MLPYLDALCQRALLLLLLLLLHRRRACRRRHGVLHRLRRTAVYPLQLHLQLLNRPQHLPQQLLRAVPAA